MKKVMIGLFIILNVISLTALATPTHTTVITAHHAGLSKLDGCR